MPAQPRRRMGAEPAAAPTQHPCRGGRCRGRWGRAQHSAGSTVCPPHCFLCKAKRNGAWLRRGGSGRPAVPAARETPGGGGGGSQLPERALASAQYAHAHEVSAGRRGSLTGRLGAVVAARRPGSRACYREWLRTSHVYSPCHPACQQRLLLHRHAAFAARVLTAPLGRSHSACRLEIALAARPAAIKSSVGMFERGRAPAAAGATCAADALTLLPHSSTALREPQPVLLNTISFEECSVAVELAAHLPCRWRLRGREFSHHLLMTSSCLQEHTSNFITSPMHPCSS